MLQKLNERIQGVIAWVVIILIAVTFTMFGVDYYMQSRGVSDAEVTVNGETISKQDYEVGYRRARQQNDQQAMSAADEADLKKQVLNGMVANLIAVEGARKAGFHVNDEQANAAILSIPQFQQDGRFSSERYQQVLSNAMFTPQSFMREVKQGMLLNQQRFTFIGSAFVLPAEVERFVKLYMQTRDYDYLQIPVALFIDKSKVSSQAIEDYYKKNQKEFVAPEQVSIEYVRLSMQKLKNQLSVNEEDVKKYYDENQNNFYKPAQWKVAHILFAFPAGASEENIEQVKQKAEEAYQAIQNNPAQFDEFVKTVSDDKLSVANQGILPWIVAGQTPFDKALSSLTKPGQISEPFKTDKGYEIFKLVAAKPAALQPFEQVKGQITQQLIADSLQSKFAQLQEQLSDLSYQTPDSLEAVAKDMNLTIERTEPFTRHGGNSDITRNTQVINTAFSHDVLEAGNNSEPVQVDNDSVIVLRVNKHIPASIKPFAEVKEDILNKLAQQEAANMAKVMGESLTTSTHSNDQIDSFLANGQIKWQSVVNASRDSDKADSAVNDLAFSLAKVNSQNGKSLENGDFVIVRLKKINDGKLQSLDNEQRASIAQQIETSYGLMDYDLYISDLTNKAKIDKSS